MQIGSPKACSFVTSIRFSAAATLVLLSACSSAPSPEASSQPAPVEPARASVPQPPFTPESGRLHVDSRQFYDAANNVWRWRGASQFLLFARYLNGEDISPQLDWLVDRGFNVLRVFGEVPAGFRSDEYGITNYERPFARADFDMKLRAFFQLLADRGLRCEYTVLTYADSTDIMRAHVQRVYDIAALQWNVFVEVANEPENNQIDPVAVMQGVNRRGVLSAYGLDPARGSREAWKSIRMLDYGTTHDLQRDLEHSAYNTKDAMDMQNAFGVPFVNDEPIGAIDPGHPHFAQNGPETWGHVGGGGARTVNRDLFISAAAIAYMYSAGYTFHFQDGLEGRVPAPSEAVQDGIAAVLRDIARFLPNETQLGSPVEPSVGADRAYGVALGDRAWAVVVPKPASTWVPAPVNGWRLDAVGPVPYLLRLAKRQD
jgi:hypothetical protein